MFKYFMIPFWIVSFLSGCGYSTKSFLPSHVNSIAVPMFKNETFRLKKAGRTFKRRLEKTVTDKVIQNFIQDGQLQVLEPSMADWVLEGTVTDYEVRPLRYSSSDAGLVEEIRLILKVSVVLKDAKSQKVIWKKKSIFREEDLYVDGSIFDEEERGLELAAFRIAKKITTEVLEGWY
ncbi:hypothetical protein AB834_02035 [PVC group bacterium (ex Bugula neritina AB1)]|nr:hypothetical protein AB834_02035 [PVC group bacterium (ex Bugula neritina AB1)]